MTLEYTSEYEHQTCRGLSALKLSKISYKVYKERKYWDINQISPYFPLITGLPEIVFEKTRPYTIINKAGIPTTRIKKAPKKCFLGKIINYPYWRWGAPMVKILGAKGEGKSNLLDLIMAMQAAKGVRMLTFNDRRLEVRSLAAHGWFDKDFVFHPFEIDIFRPKDYQYKKAENPLWNYYPNVHDRTFETADDIISSMEPHKFTVVYEECFTKESLLLLWNELVEQLAEETDSKKIYTFAHHEWARLIPENPSEEINKLVKRASENFSNFRKDKIGLDVTFHSNSYSFYQVIQRIGHLIQKAPVDKNRYTKLEKEALSYKRSDFAIKAGGRGWMKHSSGLFPELPDEFRLIADRRKLLYPSLEYEYNKNTFDDEKIELTSKEYEVLIRRANGMPYGEIGKELGINKGYVHQIKTRLDKKINFSKLVS